MKAFDRSSKNGPDAEKRARPHHCFKYFGKGLSVSNPLLLRIFSPFQPTRFFAFSTHQRVA